MRTELFVGCASGVLLVAISVSVGAQSNPSLVRGGAVVVPQQAMKVSDPSSSVSVPPGVFPHVLRRTFKSRDSTGATETYNIAAPIVTKRNPFFQSLGTNGRACVTCHEPRSAWEVSAASIQERFFRSSGTDPIFRVVDGATCPSDPVSTVSDKLNAYNLLLTKALIRIFLPLPATRDFEITADNDPYGCTDLTGTPAVVSVYRRPLPSANLAFLTECPAGQQACAPLSIMWDGREPSLASEALDATQTRARADPGVPNRTQINQIVAFESAIFDAQVFDFEAGLLFDDGATGGPAALSQQEFYIGINDSLTLGAFNPDVFTLYDAWQNNPNPDRASVARGEAIFNARQFTIHGVNGLNLFPSDPLHANDLTTGTCTTCHDSPNVGNHSKKLALNIGVADAVPPVLDVSGLPSFTVSCTDTTGELAGAGLQRDRPRSRDDYRQLRRRRQGEGPDSSRTRCACALLPQRLGRIAQRRREFLRRFNIGLTDQDKADLVNFLQTL